MRSMSMIRRPLVQVRSGQQTRVAATGVHFMLAGDLCWQAMRRLTQTIGQACEPLTPERQGILINFPVLSLSESRAVRR